MRGDDPLIFQRKEADIMKKFAKLLLLGALSVTILTGCNQWKARNVGGSYTIELPKDAKLVNISWKEGNLWYITKPMTEEDIAEEYQVQEDSLYGVFEGTITIKETKGE